MRNKLATTIGLMVIAGGSTACFDDELKGPSTCKEAKDTYNVAVDGPQTLYIDGDKSMPWSAHCVAMASAEPKEFIDLVQRTKDGHLANFSDFMEATELLPRALVLAKGTIHVQTQYEKLRIDPKTLTIDITNKAFAHTTITPEDGNHASIALRQSVGFMPYGVAMQCGEVTELVEGEPGSGMGSGSEDTYVVKKSQANIDLTDLPFELADTDLCHGVGKSMAFPDASDPTRLVNFEAAGGASSTCARASVRCVPEPTINGQVGSETTIQLRYMSTSLGFGFN